LTGLGATETSATSRTAGGASSRRRRLNPKSGSSSVVAADLEPLDRDRGAAVLARGLVTFFFGFAFSALLLFDDFSMMGCVTTR
jgi:hypothetical protein